MKRIIMFAILYGIILILAYSFKDSILFWLNERNSNDHTKLLWITLLSLFIHIVPVIPISIFSGLMGVKYGVGLGAFINWVGSIGAATLFFFLARHYFIELFRKNLAKSKHIQKFDQLVSQNAFLAVLFSRMIPIIPDQFISLSSGMSSMVFVQYFVATAIGQIPTMMMFAFLGEQLFLSITGFLITMAIYIGIILLMILSITIYQRMYKKV